MSFGSFGRMSLAVMLAALAASAAYAGEPDPYRHDEDVEPSVESS